MEEHHARGSARGDCRQPDADRRYWKNGQHRDAAGVRDCLYRHPGPAAFEPWPTSTLPDAMGSVRAGYGNPFQRLHDVQTRLDQLGAFNYLADYRDGRLLYVQPETQPGAGSVGRPQDTVRAAKRRHKKPGTS